MTNEDRANLIDLVENAKLSISRASRMLGTNYSNAMAIMRVFRKEKRTKLIRPALDEVKAATIED